MIFFTHYRTNASVLRTRTLDGMHMKRQMHSVRSIKMQISFIRAGKICVRGESVFRPSTADPPLWYRNRYVCTSVDTHAAGLPLGQSNPSEKDHGSHPLGQIFILRPIYRIDGPFSMTGHAG